MSTVLETLYNVQCYFIYFPVCKLPPDSGVGRFNATFFFYNSATGSCEEFSYKGALGNDNRFYDKDECESECKLH